jgi:cysteine desulfurase/selenocysteine lyase
MDYTDRSGELSRRASAAQPTLGGISVESIRSDFPILSERVGGYPLIFLDNAATTQRPNCVIERISRYYGREHSNVHRGAHELASRATDAYESARSAVARFIGAEDAGSIIFVRGATEGINLVANSFARPTLRPGDEIILTQLEHHANIVPWQMIASERGARLVAAPVDDCGQIILSEYEKLFNPRTRFASIAHVSNALGTVAPVGEMIAIAHRRGVPVCVDGAQSAAHMPVDVRAMDADFYVFSGHKACAPTGIGAVYGKPELLERGVPYQGGGNMIEDVTLERTRYQPPPRRYEAGTGNIAGAAGLAEALEYLTRIGMREIEKYEDALMLRLVSALADIPGLRVIGGLDARRVCAVSFVMAGRTPEEIGRRLNEYGIAVRAGHHCAQPCLRRFGLEETVRPSISFYNTFNEIDRLADALRVI